MIYDNNAGPDAAPFFYLLNSIFNKKINRQAKVSKQKPRKSGADNKDNKYLSIQAI